MHQRDRIFGQDGRGNFAVETRRTNVSSTESLDAFYTPRLPVASRHADHFVPTPLTDSDGALAPELAEDLMGKRKLRHA